MITASNVITEKVINIDGNLNPNNPFKHVSLSGNYYLGGCFDINDGTHSVGFFYYNTLTDVTVI